MQKFAVKLSKPLGEVDNIRKKEHHLPASVLHTPQSETHPSGLGKRRSFEGNRKASKASVISQLQFQAFILFHDCFLNKLYPRQLWNTTLLILRLISPSLPCGSRSGQAYLWENCLISAGDASERISEDTLECSFLSKLTIQWLKYSGHNHLTTGFSEWMKQWLSALSSKTCSWLNYHELSDTSIICPEDAKYLKWANTMEIISLELPPPSFIQEMWIHKVTAWW